MISLLNQILFFIATALTVPIGFRVFGPETYADINILNSITIFILSIIILPFYHAAAHFYKRQQDGLDIFTSAFITNSIISSTLYLSIIATFMYFNIFNDIISGVFIFFIILAESFREKIATILHCHEKRINYAINVNSAAWSRFLMISLLLIYPMPEEPSQHIFFSIFLMGSVFSILFSYSRISILKKYTKKNLPSHNILYDKKYRNYIFGFASSNIFIWILLWSDKWTLYHFTNTIPLDQIGTYFACFQIILAPYTIIVTSAIMHYGPRVISFKNKIRKDRQYRYINHVTKKIMQIYSIIGILGFALSIFVAPPILNWILGVKYNLNSETISLLSLQCFLSAFFSIIYYQMQTLEKFKESIFILIISTIVMIILLGVLVPYYGLIGAALSCILATISRIGIFFIPNRST